MATKASTLLSKRFSPALKPQPRRFPLKLISLHRRCMVSRKFLLVWNLKCNEITFQLVITTSTSEKVDGLKALENAIEKIEKTIYKLDGHFAIQMAVSSFCDGSLASIL